MYQVDLGENIHQENQLKLNNPILSQEEKQLMRLFFDKRRKESNNS